MTHLVILRLYSVMRLVVLLLLCNGLYDDDDEYLDLDSIITPLAFSFIRQQFSNQRPLIPCINTFTPRVLDMRGEIKLALEGMGLHKEDFLTMEEIFTKTSFLSSSHLTTVLIDHNEISRQWQQRIEFTQNHPNQLAHEQVKVVAILDHHVDAGQYLDVSFRVIEPCGSCASLLVREIVGQGQRDEIDRLGYIAFPLLQTIIFDTVNLTWRQTSIDLEAVDYLSRSLRSPSSTTRSLTNMIYEQLEQAIEKTPESQFGIYELLHKDFKYYEHATNSSSLIYSYGIATLHLPVSTMIGTSTTTLKTWTGEVRRFMGDNKLRILVMTIAIREKHIPGHYQQLVIFTENSQQTSALYDFFQSHDLGLTRIISEKDYILADQANIQISRKQLHPLMKEFLSKSE